MVAIGVVLFVAAPLLFTDSTFGGDFITHLWLTWVAGKALVQVGHPVYFLNLNGAGVFDPWFAFYGGTLYTLTGGLGDLLGGDAVLAFVVVTTLAIAGAYGGTLWLARQLGLRGWIGHAPALVVVTSAYYVTDLYGRGAWPEFVAVSAIAPLLASTLALVRSPTWQSGPALIFVVSAIIFSGSHNITLLWGSTIILAGVLMLWLVLGRPTHLPLRRLASVGALGFASVCVNAWFLLPDIAYGRYLRIYKLNESGAGYGFFDAPQVLFDPLRHVPRQSQTPALFVQVPDWFLAWAALAGIVLLWHQPRTYTLRRSWLGASVLLVIVLGLMGFLPVWHWIRPPFSEIQFPYRLDSYVTYAVSALVLISGLALQRSSLADRLPPARQLVRLRLALAGACAISLGLCAWQLWVPNTHAPGNPYVKRSEGLRSTATPPATWAGGEAFYDAHAPLVNAAPGRSLILDASDVKGDRYSAWLTMPTGLGAVRTNIGGGSYLVGMSGITRLGRDTAGYAVVRRTKPGHGPVHVVVETARSITIVLGWVVTILACLAIFFTQVVAAARRWRSSGSKRRPLPNRSRHPNWRNPLAARRSG